MYKHTKGHRVCVCLCEVCVKNEMSNLSPSLRPQQPPPQQKPFFALILPIRADYPLNQVSLAQIVLICIKLCVVRMLHKTLYS